MDDEEMLDQLDAHGADADSDYNDGDDVLGWFGWRVQGDVLTVTYKPEKDNGTPGEAQTASWRLVPVTGT